MTQQQTHTGQTTAAEPLRLHLGGQVALPGWKIVDIQKRPEVDYVGSVTDLSAFADGTVSEVYASHVWEHLSHTGEVQKAAAEAFRVLRPGGELKVGVPDLDVICRLFLDQRLTMSMRLHVLKYIYGGQIDGYDYHKFGFNFPVLGQLLHETGFVEITKLPSFGICNDCTEINFYGARISLNVRAKRPG
ncbi:MAG: methyltransferase type 11 [Planctomyces sp.]|nr:methyltransferase type 11 [Planctomyces sp.]MBA4120515.1 methyltransferase type 11 [Isosphaera sp.]